MQIGIKAAGATSEKGRPVMEPQFLYQTVVWVIFGKKKCSAPKDDF